MIHINAAFKDMIDLALYRQAQLDEKEFDKKTIEDEHNLMETTVFVIRDLLNKNALENCKVVEYDYGNYTDCVLVVQRHLTEEEKQKEIEDCKGNLDYAKSRLRRWMEKPENKDMILTYLDHHNIKIKGVN